MLKGFNYPLTPTGKSTLNPSPPWHYSADFLDIALVTLKEPVTDRALLNQRPIVNLLHYPQLAADKRDEPAIHQLVENMPHDLKIEQAWTGAGSLTLPVCRGEELSDLAPGRCGKGIRASMAYIVDDLKTLKGLMK